MELQQAEALAQHLVNIMAPYCQRIEIGGSIRRKKKSGIKDIELIVVPSFNEQSDPSDLFGERTLRINRLHQWAMSPECQIQWLKPGVPGCVPWPVHAEGKYWRGLSPEGIKLDCFLTTPGNFGAIFLIRTGSADFSYGVANRGKTLGRQFVNGWLTDEDGRPVETPEERDVFEWLGLEWREPEQRTGWDAVQPIKPKSNPDRFFLTEDDIEIIKPARQYPEE